MRIESGKGRAVTEIQHSAFLLDRQCAKGGQYMRALVTGVKGQLGHDVMNELAKRGYEGVGVDVEEMDITDAEAVDLSSGKQK